MAGLENSNVLTIGETEDFLEGGGMIRFLMEGKKLHFEINLEATQQARLRIDTTILKLAKRVIQKKGQPKK